MDNPEKTEEAIKNG